MPFELKLKIALEYLLQLPWVAELGNIEDWHELIDCFDTCDPLRVGFRLVGMPYPLAFLPFQAVCDEIYGAISQPVFP